VRRAVRRFMPGETLDEALAAAAALAPERIGTILTCLGESLTEDPEADAVEAHYRDALDRIAAQGLVAEISVKPTQLGLDLDRERCFGRLRRLLEHAAARDRYVWVDMEQSRYVDETLDLVRRGRQVFTGIGVALQAYLRRTPADLAAMLGAGIGVRLVKGAYDEPASVAFPDKKDVDAAYLELARTMLARPDRAARAVFGTHDDPIIEAIRAEAARAGTPAGSHEFHLLYGIRRPLQQALAGGGEHVRVLISYGEYWFPWYMRRLAERPANVLFVLKSLVRS
jgi:proline dehydrogenase